MLDAKPTTHVNDDKIESRLFEVLQSSKRFENLDIQSNEGVITLNGVAKSSEDREFAEEVAKKLEGVIHVQSELSIKNPDKVVDFNLLKESLRDIQQEFIGNLPKFVLGAIILLAGVIFLKMGTRFVGPVLERKYKNHFLTSLMTKVYLSPIFIIITYLALQVTGLTKLAVTVLTGTGLAGLAVGIAFRNIAENFFASVLLSFQRPYEIGDLIKIGEHTGYVRQLSSRGTTLMTLDGNHVQIPNAQAYTQTLTNYSANKNLRRFFQVGIGYDDDIANAQKIALEVARNHPQVLNKPQPIVHVESLGASTVNLGVYFWLDSSKYSQFKVSSSMIRLVKESFDRAGISMPDEAREIIFPQGVPVVGEEGSKAEGNEVQRFTPAFHNLGDDFESEYSEIAEQALQSRPLEGGENLL